MKRVICGILASILFLVPVLVSCSSNEISSEVSNTTSNEVMSTIVTESETELSDSLPKLNYDGAVVNILTAAEQWQNFYISNQDGDVVNDAVFKRNTNIEDRFKVKLNYEVLNGYSAGREPVKAALSGSVLSATGDYDIMVGCSQYVTPLIAEGLFADLNNQSYIDFTKPWWYSNVNSKLKLMDKQYLAAGCYGMTTVAWSVVTFFSKLMAENYNLGNIYDLVDEGKWTYDKMTELAEKVTTDLNGDGIYTKDDNIGIVSTVDYMSYTAISMDYNYIKNDENNKIVLTGLNDKILKINEYIYNTLESDLYMNDADLGEEVGGQYSRMCSMFASNHSLFMIHRLALSGREELRSMDNYGIIPAPKYDEAQEKYTTPIISEVCGIPSFVKDNEMASVLLEALNYETYKTVYPVYIDIALSRKYSRDNESAKMLDIIFDNVNCDQSHLFIYIVGPELVYSVGKNMKYSSWFAANEEIFTGKLQDFMKSVEAVNVSKG